MVETIETPKWLYDTVRDIIMDKGFKNIPSFLEEYNLIDKFTEYYGYRPLENWLNLTLYKDGTINGFPWHNELGVAATANGKNPHKGTKASIIWVMGDESSGGELMYIDKLDMPQAIPFNTNTCINMDIDTFHSVNPYYHNTIPRVSLNTTW